MDPQALVRRLTSRLTTAPGAPLSHLVAEEIWEAVVDGTLDTGTRLPTTRQLAVGLGVSPASVERAYADLEARGVVVSRVGEGRYVSLGGSSVADLERRRALTALCGEIVDRARELGIGIDEVIAELGEYRTVDRHPTTPEGG
jgi:GntR family transcriptional regulator